MAEKQYLIDKLAKEPNFSISSIPDKLPLYVGEYLKTGDKRDITIVNNETAKHLPTLNQIKADSYLKNLPVAYHMHAKDNLIIGFDVENFEGEEFDKLKFKAPHRTDPEYLAWFAHLPAHYREYSNHYGIHIFYQLRRSSLSDNALQMLSERTEYKLNTVINNRKINFEVMMNNHWLTMTGRTFGDVVDLSHDAPQDIYDLLNREAENWVKAQHTAVQFDISKEITPLAKNLEKFFNNNKYNELKNLTVDDFDGDDSKYEYNVALSVAGSLAWRLDHPKPLDFSVLNEDPATISDSDLTWAVADLLSELVPKRPKDDEKRNNLPWLVYVAQQAVQYIRSNPDTDLDNAQDVPEEF